MALPNGTSIKDFIPDGLPDDWDAWPDDWEEDLTQYDLRGCDSKPDEVCPLLEFPSNNESREN